MAKLRKQISGSENTTREMRENTSSFSGVCRTLMQIEDVPGPKGRRLLVAHAIIWAALIIATAIIISSADASETYAYLLITVLVPAWFASDQLLRRALR